MQDTHLEGSSTVEIASDSKHTPGPWVTDGYRVFAPGMPKVRYGEKEQYEHEYIVCQPSLYVTPKWGSEEMLANARLIASAPQQQAIINNLRAVLVEQRNALAAATQRVEQAEASLQKADALHKAFLAGWMARHTNQPSTICPFEEDSSNGQWWMKGWVWRNDSLENDELRKRAEQAEAELVKVRAKVQVCADSCRLLQEEAHAMQMDMDALRQELEEARAWVDVDYVCSAVFPHHMYVMKDGFDLCDDDGTYLWEFRFADGEYRLQKRRLAAQEGQEGHDGE